LEYYCIYFNVIDIPELQNDESHTGEREIKATDMIVYNVTIKCAWSIQEEWQEWMKLKHIPDVLATGQFDTGRLFRLLDQDESEGPTFVAQYATSSPERYQRYIIEFAPALQENGRSKWGDQFIAFRTVMSLL
jgi:uncharacterized protein DUF4286